MKKKGEKEIKLKIFKNQSKMVKTAKNSEKRHKNHMISGQGRLTLWQY